VLKKLKIGRDARPVERPDLRSSLAKWNLCSRYTLHARNVGDHRLPPRPRDKDTSFFTCSFCLPQVDSCCVCSPFTTIQQRLQIFQTLSHPSEKIGIHWKLYLQKAACDTSRPSGSGCFGDQQNPCKGQADWKAGPGWSYSTTLKVKATSLVLLSCRRLFFFSIAVFLCIQ